MRSRLLVGLTLLMACAGADGATGPQGPQGQPGATGPQGAPGPGTSTTLTALVASDGRASVTLPAAAGSDPNRPPALACFMTQTVGSGVWLGVGDGFSTTSAFCALVFASGGWRAIMVQAPAGWTAAFVVVY